MISYPEFRAADTDQLPSHDTVQPEPRSESDRARVRGTRRPRVAGEARRAALGRRNPLLPPTTLLRPREGSPAARHARVRRERPPRDQTRWAVRHPDRQPRLLEVHQGSGAVLLRLP